MVRKFNNLMLDWFHVYWIIYCNRIYNHQKPHTTDTSSTSRRSWTHQCRWLPGRKRWQSCAKRRLKLTSALSRATRQSAASAVPSTRRLWKQLETWRRRRTTTCSSRLIWTRRRSTLWLPKTFKCTSWLLRCPRITPDTTSTCSSTPTSRTT